MKLILPNGVKIELDKELPYESKRKIVDEILQEWSPYFTKYRNKKTSVCLEILSNYLCHEKKEKPELQVGE
jgi:hypothetical protein